MRFVPHQISFNDVRLLRSFSDITLGGTTILTSLIFFEVAPPLALNALNTTNSILILLFILAEILTGLMLFRANTHRRLDLIDNSFGTNLSGIKSTDYYSNSNLEAGLPRMAVNCFENAFYTNQIARRMLPMVALKSLLIICLFVASATMGQVKLLVLLFQLSLPFILLHHLVKLLFYYFNTEKVLEGFMTLFDDLKEIDANVNSKTKSAQILKHILDYEANIAWGSILLSEKLFKKLNAKLSLEWNDLKRGYGID